MEIREKKVGNRERASKITNRTNEHCNKFTIEPNLARFTFTISAFIVSNYRSSLCTHFFLSRVIVAASLFVAHDTRRHLSFTFHFAHVIPKVQLGTHNICVCMCTTVTPVRHRLFVSSFSVCSIGVSCMMSSSVKGYMTAAVYIFPILQRFLFSPFRLSIL